MTHKVSKDSVLTAWAWVRPVGPHDGRSQGGCPAGVNPRTSAQRRLLRVLRQPREGSAPTGAAGLLNWTAGGPLDSGPNFLGKISRVGVLQAKLDFSK